MEEVRERVMKGISVTEELAKVMQGKNVSTGGKERPNKLLTQNVAQKSSA